MSWSKWGKYFRIIYYFSPMLLIKAVTFATYAFLASSLLVPFFLFQASHLALPFKSNKPGFAGNKRGFESLQCTSFNNNNDCLIRNACKAKLWVAKPGEEYDEETTTTDDHNQICSMTCNTTDWYHYIIHE